MAFYANKITELDELIDQTYNGQGPSQFSFLGIMDRHTHEAHEKHPNRVHHELVLHDGSKSRLHVQYITGYDDEHIYDNRVIDDHNDVFYPKASLCFLPRLEITYAEDDSLYCTFKGGDCANHPMIEPLTTEQRSQVIKKRKLEEESGEKIELIFDTARVVQHSGSNRVCLIIDAQPSSINEFLTRNEVKSSFQTYLTFFPSRCLSYKKQV